MSGEKWLVRVKSTSVLKTLSNFYDGALLKAVNYFRRKSSVVDVRLGSKYTSGKITISILYDWNICRDPIKHPQQQLSSIS